MALKEGWCGRFFEDFVVRDVNQHPLGRTASPRRPVLHGLLLYGPSGEGPPKKLPSIASDDSPMAQRTAYDPDLSPLREDQRPEAMGFL